MGGLTIENNFFILKMEKRNKIIVFDFPKVGAGAQKSGGAAALPAPPPPRSLLIEVSVKRESNVFIILAPTRRVDSIEISLSRDLRAYTLAFLRANFPLLRTHILSLMKAALSKHRSFICNYQRLTYHLPTFCLVYMSILMLVKGFKAD